MNMNKAAVIGKGTIATINRGDLEPIEVTFQKHTSKGEDRIFIELNGQPLVHFGYSKDEESVTISVFGDMSLVHSTYSGVVENVPGKHEDESPAPIWVEDLVKSLVPSKEEK
jgi:hypothetical protein